MLDRLAKIGKVQQHLKDDVVFTQGDFQAELYIILQGAVRMEIYDVDTGGIHNVILEAGNFFGEMAIIDKMPRSATAIVEEEGTMLLCVNEAGFKDFIKEEPDFAVRIMSNMSLKLRNNNDELAQAIKRLEKLDPENLTADREANKFGDDNMKEMIRTLKNTGIIPMKHRMYNNKDYYRAKEVVSERKVACPICDNNFTSVGYSVKELGQPFILESGRYTYTGIEPIYFDVHTCENCGYSNFSEDYQNVSQGDRTRLAEKLNFAGCIPKNFNENSADVNYVFLKHYFAIFSALNMQADVQHIVGRLWLRLSYLYEDVTDLGMNVYAAEEATNAFEETYFDSKVISEDGRARAGLILSELYLMTNKAPEANKFLMNMLGEYRYNPDLQREIQNKLARIKSAAAFYEL